MFGDFYTYLRSVPLISFPNHFDVGLRHKDSHSSPKSIFYYHQPPTFLSFSPKGPDVLIFNGNIVYFPHCHCPKPWYYIRHVLQKECWYLQGHLTSNSLQDSRGSFQLADFCFSQWICWKNTVRETGEINMDQILKGHVSWIKFRFYLKEREDLADLSGAVYDQSGKVWRVVRLDAVNEGREKYPWAST